MKNTYPTRAFTTEKNWLRDVRKRWVRFRRSFSYYSNKDGDTVRSGSIYYPPEVMEWLGQFNKMNRLMKEYYKKVS